MDDREKLIEETIAKYEEAYFQANGFIMNSKQKKILKKEVEKMIDNKLKRLEKIYF